MNRNEQLQHPQEEQPADEEDLMQLSPDRHNQQSIMDFQLAGSEQKQTEDEPIENGAVAHQTAQHKQEEEQQEEQPQGEEQLPHSTSHVPSAEPNDQHSHENSKEHSPTSPETHREQSAHREEPVHPRIHSSLPTITNEAEPEVTKQPSKHRNAHSSENVRRLNQYLERNEQALLNIMREFSGEDSIDQSQLFNVLTHLLSVEPIDITSSGDNILYAEGYGEPMLMELFASFRQEYQIPGDKPLDYEEITAYLIHIVEREHLEISYTFKPQRKKPTNEGAVTPVTKSPQTSMGASLNLREELQATRKRYEVLLSAREVTEQQRKMIGEMISNIDFQLNGTVPKGVQKQPTTEREILPFSTAEALETVFDFYCKQSYATGKNATFDRIKHESNILTMNKFMLFCRDFAVISGSKQDNEEVELLKMPDLVEIFKKHSINHKEMTFQQFTEALQKIAERMFPSNEASLSQLHNYMGVNDEANFREQVRRLKIPYVFKEGKKPSKPLGYKIHKVSHQKLAEEPKASAKSVGKNTAESGKRSSLEGVPSSQNNGSVQNLLKPLKLSQAAKRQELSRPPMLPLPKKPNRLVLEDPQKGINASRARLSTKMLTPAPPSEGPMLQASNKQLQLQVPTATRYSEIHAAGKKRGITVPLPSSAEDKKQFKLNAIVSDARNMVQENNYKETSFNRQIEQQYIQQQEEKMSLGNLLDDNEQDQYLNKHWQIQKNLSHNELNLKINEKLQQIRQEELVKERAVSVASSLTNNRQPAGKIGSIQSKYNS